MARLAFHIALAKRQGEERIPLQIVMVVEILIAQREAIHPLTHQLQHAVLDELR